MGEPGWDSEVELDRADVPTSELAPGRVAQQLRLEWGMPDLHVEVAQT